MTVRGPAGKATSRGTDSCGKGLVRHPLAGAISADHHVPVRAKRWTRITAMALSTAACVLNVAGFIDVTVLEHRLQHMDIQFPSGDGPDTWLFVGSDARTAGSKAAIASQQRLAGARADIILLVRPHAHPSVVSVPRDVLLATATGGLERAALTFADSPQALVDGVCRTLGIAVQHTAFLTMGGFASVIDALGGIRVNVYGPVRDRRARLYLRQTGDAHLTGLQALALVRSRHPERFVSGRWVASGDNAGAGIRARTAASVFTAVARRAAAQRLNLIALQRAAWAATGAFIVDSHTELSDLIAVAVAPDGTTRVLPTIAIPHTIAVRVDRPRTTGLLGNETHCGG
jgi:LCP family protein required for cell wall assembly